MSVVEAAKLTGEQLRAALQYDPATGMMTWIKPSKNNMKLANQVAGWLNQKGYREIRVFGAMYPAHRLAWLWMTNEWPPDHIDHINRVRDDNRWENLRLANRFQQLGNTVLRKCNKSGFRGVHYFKSGRYIKRWRAQIRVAGKARTIGYFHTPEEAHHAYENAARDAFGDYYTGTNRPRRAALSDGGA